MHVRSLPLWILILCISVVVVYAFPSSRTHSGTKERNVVRPVVAETTRTATDGGKPVMAEVRQRLLIREDLLWQEALRIHYNGIVVDGHIDTPSLMLDSGYRFNARHRSVESNVDLPRMYEGGLDAVFAAIYVAPPYGEGERATGRARDMIAEVKQQVRAHPDSMELALTPSDVIRITRSGKKAILMGIEGGHALAGSPRVLREMFDAGVRYVSITHINTNSWADASQSAARWNGLNDLGVRMIREMNDLGMLVDLSHASDATFYDAVKASRAPVILSHSSMRALVDNVRNVDDDMLKALSRNGGLVMINFFDPMVNPHLTRKVWDEVHRRLPGPDLHALWNVVYDVKREWDIEGATVDDIVNHVDHAIKVAGIDHVGLGSDFDGVFDLPGGMQDVTRLPWITYGLLKKGYSEEDVYKILGGNLLRVMGEVQSKAKRSALTRND